MRKILIFVSLLTLSFAESYQSAVVKNELVFSNKEFAGEVYSPNEKMISSRISGFIKNIYVEEGDFVKSGDVLFEIDPTDIESQINQAQNQLTQAKSGVAIAKSALNDSKRDYERFKDLYEKGVYPKRDFEKVELDLNIKKSQLDIAQSVLKQAETSLNYAKSQIKYSKVTAQSDGVVISKLKKTAELAIPGQPILVISSTDILRVYANVNESELGNLNIGKDVSVFVPSLKERLDGKVSAVVPSIDPTTRSYKIKVDLINSKKGLMPGMFAKIEATTQQRETILAPISALTKRGGIDGVFVVQDFKAIFYPIKIRERFSEKVEIEGVSSGQKVILYPPMNLKDGDSIKE